MLVGIAAICYTSDTQLALFGVYYKAKRSDGNAYFLRSGYAILYKRLVDSADVSLEELFAQDRSQLLLLPATPFDVVRWDAATVDKYGRIKLDKHHYHGVPAGAGERVIVKAYWNTVQILNQNYEVIAQYPRIYHQDEEAVNWEAQFTLFSRKPGAVQACGNYDSWPNGNEGKTKVTRRVNNFCW